MLYNVDEALKDNYILYVRVCMPNYDGMGEEQVWHPIMVSDTEGELEEFCVKNDIDYKNNLNCKIKPPQI